jgi:mycoredoxin
LPHAGRGTPGPRGKERTAKVVARPEDPRKAGCLPQINEEIPVPLTMYTTTWCGFCKNLKRQLNRAGVEVTEVDIELDPAAAEFVMSVNGGNQTVPTMLFDDGSTMCNPSAAQVQKKLAQLASAAS